MEPKHYALCGKIRQITTDSSDTPYIVHDNYASSDKDVRRFFVILLGLSIVASNPEVTLDDPIQTFQVSSLSVRDIYSCLFQLTIYYLI